MTCATTAFKEDTALQQDGNAYIIRPHRPYYICRCSLLLRTE